MTRLWSCVSLFHIAQVPLQPCFHTCCRFRMFSCRFALGTCVYVHFCVFNFICHFVSGCSHRIAVRVPAYGGNFKGRVGGNIGGKIIDIRKPNFTENSCPTQVPFGISGERTPSRRGQITVLVKLNRFLFREYEYLPARVLV